MAASYCNALAWETAHGLVLRWMAVMDQHHLQHHCLAAISDGVQRWTAMWTAYLQLNVTLTHDDSSRRAIPRILSRHRHRWR
jgi:hypothetical protein